LLKRAVAYGRVIYFEGDDEIVFFSGEFICGQPCWVFEFIWKEFSDETILLRFCEPNQRLIIVIFSEAVLFSAICHIFQL